jgi:tight adherence protein C
VTGALLAGAVVGLGLYALLRVFVRPRPGIATLVARVDAGRRSMTGHTATGLEHERGLAGGARGMYARLADWLEVQAAERGWRFGQLRQDLAVMNRSFGALSASMLLFGLGMFLLGPVLWTILEIAGLPLPGGAPFAVALVLGAFGFFLPVLVLRGEAAARRRDFRRVVGSFLDLVAMNLAGGRGLPEALLAASTVSDHWTLIRIRQSLANARLRGTTPWAALGELGEQVGVEELRDLSGALALASDDGAKIRASLSSRAATMRRKELTDTEGDAGEKSQSMLVAQLLICAAFLLFLAYPAIARILAS